MIKLQARVFWKKKKEASNIGSNLKNWQMGSHVIKKKIFHVIKNRLQYKGHLSSKSEESPPRVRKYPLPTVHLIGEWYLGAVRNLKD